METKHALLEEQLTSMRRSVIEQKAEALRIKPVALWAAGISHEELLNDQGVPDDTLIAAAVQHARETLGIPVPLKAATPFSGGNRGDDIEAADDTAPSWGDVIHK